MSRMNVEELLETPCWIIDILPARVPEDSPGQVFAVEAYYREEPRRTEVRRKLTGLVMKLNCYRSVSLDGGETRNPPPARIAEALENGQAVMLPENAMIIADPEDHYMALWNPDEPLLDLVRTLAAGEGLFVWKGSPETPEA